MKGEIHIINDPIGHEPVLLLTSGNSEIIIGSGGGNVLPTIEVRFRGEEVQKSIKSAVRRSPQNVLESDVSVCVVGDSVHLSVNLKIANPTEFIINRFLRSEGLENVFWGNRKIGAIFVITEGGFLMSDLKDLFFDICERVGEFRFNLTVAVKNGETEEIKTLWWKTLNSVSYFLRK